MLPISTVIGLQTGLPARRGRPDRDDLRLGWRGPWLFEAAVDKDFLVIQSGDAHPGPIFVLVNLVVDISYAYLNPRIRYS